MRTKNIFVALSLSLRLAGYFLLACAQDTGDLENPEFNAR
jgi:hypothetical protein